MFLILCLSGTGLEGNQIMKVKRTVVRSWDQHIRKAGMTCLAYIKQYGSVRKHFLIN